MRKLTRIRAVTVAAIGLTAAPAARAARIVVPVVASLQGRARFQSDARVFNGSYTDTIPVTATYFCASPSCGVSPQTISLAPRESLALDDIAANLFGAPGTQGAVTFEADSDAIVVTSRLFSLDSAGGSVGQFVAGTDVATAGSTLVLTSLRNGPDSRTNLALFNPSASTAHAAIFLFDGDGAQMGSFTFPALAPNQFFPAVSLFSVTGSGDARAENAYAVVVSDQPIFATAAVLDNISEDTISIPGASDQPFVPKARPAVSFTAAPAHPNPGDAVAFTDTSTGAPTSWNWNFGDGSTETAQNPTHTFALPNVFAVRLEATNSEGAGTHTSLLTVGAVPHAAFTLSPPAARPGAAVSFTDASTSSPSSWSWNFGDPTSGGADTAAIQNPVHAYAAPGVYTITLVASNGIGASAPASHTVAVGDPPVASFAFAPANPNPGSPVTFTDQSTGTPTSWHWNFGNPSSGIRNTSTDQNPSHVFAKPGSYTVALKASNAVGTSPAASVTVRVASPPSASFQFSPAAPAAQAPVAFTDTSAGNPTSWSWDFGDPASGEGNVSTARDPSHTFAAAGSYAVTLVASSDFGASAPASRMISVAVPPPLPVVIEMQQFTFNHNTPITLHVGVAYQLVFRALDNGEGFGHGFPGIPQLGLNGHQQIVPGADFVEDFTPQPGQQGRYPFSCSTTCGSGHADMVGILVVQSP